MLLARTREHLLDQRRAELRVDRLLERGALVVRDVDGARQLDEHVVEGAVAHRLPDQFLHLLDEPRLDVRLAV